MKINLKTTIITASSFLVLGLLLGWVFFGSSESKTTDDHRQDKEFAGETTWTCSMHPQIRSNEPGKCPICAMDLIPLDSEQDEELDPKAISMSSTAMQLASVSTALVGRMDPVKTLRLNGKVQTDERMIYSQSSHIPGRIEKLMVNFTGEYVNKGQAIAYIYSPELVSAQEELFEAQKIKDTQPQLFRAAKEKLKNWKLSEDQIDKILQSGALIEEFPVLADVSGYVTDKMVNLGDYIGRGKSIYEIADLSKVWVLFDVYESDMVWIKKGDKVSFTIQSLPGETFQGIISYLDPVIDPKTRVARARVEFNNSNNQLKPEMFASGIIEARLPKKSNAVVIPKTAVMWTGKRSVVYVKSTSDKGVSFLMRNVTLGPALGESYIIESGLQEGEEIAVNGTFSIDAAAQLAGKPSMMNPEGGKVSTGHDHGGINMSVETEQPNRKTNKNITIDTKGKDELQPVLLAYLKMKDALVADNMEDAQKFAGDIQAAISQVNMSLFKGESHNAWMKYDSDLKNALQHVSHLKSIEEVRKTFQQVSETMIALTESFKPFDKNLYVQFCPMANDNKGAYWLSESEEIRNPYFGDAMLGCGENKETIKY